MILYKATGIRGEHSLISTFSRSSCGGEVFVSLWSLERLGRGVVRSRRNDNVAWSYLNGGENCLGGVSSYFSIYNSMLNVFF